MEPGTFTFRLNVLVKPSAAGSKSVKIPIDAVIQPKKTNLPHLPLLIEAKSAGDFTNVNKRRKEEATKINQLKPILPGPRHLTEDVIETLPNGVPKLSPQLFLLDCNEPEENIKAAWPRFYEYLQKGRKQDTHASYLASHRTPWYSQEQRPPAPFLCTYMGRSRNGKHPFRFLWNRSQATAHNVYLMLYPKGQLRDALAKNPGLQGRVFEALQSITPAQFLSEGRVYGGGLHKVEPKELAQIPAGAILDRLDADVVIDRQECLFA